MLNFVLLIIKPLRFNINNILFLLKYSIFLTFIQPLRIITNLLLDTEDIDYFCKSLLTSQHTTYDNLNW